MQICLKHTDLNRIIGEGSIRLCSCTPPKSRESFKMWEEPCMSIVILQWLIQEFMNGGGTMGGGSKGEGVLSPCRNFC